MGKKEGTWGACFTCDPDDPQPPEVPQLQLPGHTARSIIATTIHLLLQCLSWYIQRTYYRILTITDITGLHCIGLQASLKDLRRESSAGVREVDLAPVAAQ